MTTQEISIEPINEIILLNAYMQGYFPMAEPDSGEIEWFSPDPRAIFELHEFRIPRSLRQTLTKNIFTVRVNTKFEEVIRSCAQRKETWISETIIQSYLALHRAAHAHSVEVFTGESLAGGLYGVAIGGAFFGESMFTVRRDASKVALAALVERLKERGYLLLDTQFMTPHLARFGAKEIKRDAYLLRLNKALQKRCTFID